MAQIGLFPTVTLLQIDPATLGSVDAAYFGLGEDGIEYVVKTVLKTPTAPSAEWICHRLCVLCSIAIPQISIVDVPKEGKAFGSQWDSAAQKDGSLVEAILKGKVPVNLLASRLAAIHAFDLFVHNDDRHFGNYLCVKASDASGIDTYAIRAYDFSRAWHYHGWPLPALPLPAASNTTMAARNLAKHVPYDLSAALDTLQRIENISVGSFSEILKIIPNKWLEKSKKNAMIKWWASRDRRSRIDGIRKGLTNGAYM